MTNRGPTSRLRSTGTAGGELCARQDQKITYLPFQRRFLARSLRPGVAIAALSVPRGEGKSLLAADLLTEALPDGCRYLAGGESVLLAGSMNQARTVFRFLRERYPCPNHTERKCSCCGLRWTDSYQRIGVTHWRTDTRITVRGKSGKLALGLANCPIIVGDEPASWDVLGGQEMIDALITAAGKTRQLLCLIGTLAPGVEGGWWRDLIAAGSQPGIYVQSLQAHPEKLDQWREVLRVNPVATVNPILRAALRREFDEAKRDDRARARFLSYRLNVPTVDQRSVLLTVAEWRPVLAREVPDRRGRPSVGVDVGAGRAWSAATAVYPNGRVESVAIAPGTPSLADQEKRDQVPRGTYQQLAAAGVLTTDGDRRVPRVSALVKRIIPWRPSTVTCDRFRLAEFQDATRGRVAVRPRGATVVRGVGGYSRVALTGARRTARDCDRGARVIERVACGELRPVRHGRIVAPGQALDQQHRPGRCRGVARAAGDRDGWKCITRSSCRTAATTTRR